MSATVAITVEGVLQAEVGDGVIDSGHSLYEALSTQFKVALISDQEPKVVNHWLNVNGFDRHNILVPNDVADPEDVTERRLTQIRRLKLVGCDIRYAIDANPEVTATLVRNGIPALTYTSPVYARPEFRPDWDGSVKPWGQLEAEVDRTRQLRAADKRAEKEAN